MKTFLEKKEVKMYNENKEESKTCNEVEVVQKNKIPKKVKEIEDLSMGYFGDFLENNQKKDFS